MNARSACILMTLYANPSRYPPTVNSANLLAEAGFKVWLVFNDLGNSVPLAALHPDVTLESVSRGERGKGGKICGFVEFLFRAAQLARGLRPVAIIGYDMHGLAAARLARWMSADSMLIYHCHDVWEVPFRFTISSLVKQLEPAGARAADLVIFPDKERAGRYRAESNVSVAPLVVANAPRRTAPGAGGLLRQHLSPSHGDRKIVLRHGALGPGHCLETTIRSIPKWPENAVLILVGNVRSAYREELERLADSVNCRSRVVILDFVRYPDILRYIPDADLGLALYDAETGLGAGGFAGTASNKALEFVAAGVPCVVDEHPASRIYPEEGVGVQVDPRDPGALGRTIRDLLGNTERLREMRERARRWHEEEMNYETQFAPVLQLLMTRAG